MGLGHGRFDATRAALEQLDELTAEVSDLQFRGTYYMLRSELALEEGRPKDAYEDVERALAQAAGTDDESVTPGICPSASGPWPTSSLRHDCSGDASTRTRLAFSPLS